MGLEIGVTEGDQASFSVCLPLGGGRLERGAHAYATPEPVPFYVDIEREGFATPALVQFFYVRRQPGTREQAVEAQLEEVHGAAWFGLEDVDGLKTFDQ